MGLIGRMGQTRPRLHPLKADYDAASIMDEVDLMDGMDKKLDSGSGVGMTGTI
jgi:hypothetical protein